MMLSLSLATVRFIAAGYEGFRKKKRKKGCRKSATL